MSIDISTGEGADAQRRTPAGVFMHPAARILVLVAALLPLAIIGITLATAHRAGSADGTSRLPKGPPTLDAAEIARKAAGFQQRGTSLVGEICSREGIPVRVVLDAQSRKVLGLNVLDRDLPGCEAGSLQGKAAPAN